MRIFKFFIASLVLLCVSSFAMAADKTVSLSFDLINIEGRPTGPAGPTVSIQMNAYIAKMQREGQTVIVEAMQAAQAEAAMQPYILNMTNSQFAIVYTWLTDYSGFYGQARTQLIAAFDAAKSKKKK